jgi:hypothetical protein
MFAEFLTRLTVLRVSKAAKFCIVECGMIKLYVMMELQNAKLIHP